MVAGCALCTGLETNQRHPLVRVSPTSEFTLSIPLHLRWAVDDMSSAFDGFFAPFAVPCPQLHPLFFVSLSDERLLSMEANISSRRGAMKLPLFFFSRGTVSCCNHVILLCPVSAIMGWDK